MKKKKAHDSKARLHKRSKHRERYDLKALVADCPELKEYIVPNKYGDDSINFSEPKAVKLLNKALLLHHYNLEFWDIPEGYLCPPVPGRVDYIHHVADILFEANPEKDMTGPDIKCLDIGVGANCIYPIVGRAEYGWSFVGADVDTVAIENCNNIITKNPALSGHVEVRLQENKYQKFKDIIKEGEHYHMVVCNPPFHASPEEVEEANLRKLSNLKGTQVKKTKMNFAGQENELWYEGGEVKFIQRLIREGKQFSDQVEWFSTLVSKTSHVNRIYGMLREAKVKKAVLKDMGTGNKVSRVVAWRF
ncbi:MAG: 23S rRNA (adenine(1618)-N(6))-methyltransferase RlmF [Saprospiraceae bacterium]